MSQITDINNNDGFTFGQTYEWEILFGSGSDSSSAAATNSVGDSDGNYVLAAADMPNRGQVGNRWLRVSTRLTDALGFETDFIYTRQLTDINTVFDITVVVPSGNQNFATGHELTVSIKTLTDGNGITDNGGTIFYQWQGCRPGVTANCESLVSVITNLTANVYTLSTNSWSSNYDRIRVSVQFVDGLGFPDSAMQTPPEIVNGDTQGTAQITLSGQNIVDRVVENAAAGNIVTATFQPISDLGASNSFFRNQTADRNQRRNFATGADIDPYTYTYRWLSRDGSELAIGNSNTYTLSATDATSINIGLPPRVEITVADVFGYTTAFEFNIGGEQAFVSVTLESGTLSASITPNSILMTNSDGRYWVSFPSNTDVAVPVDGDGNVNPNFALSQDDAGNRLTAPQRGLTASPDASGATLTRPWARFVITYNRSKGLPTRHTVISKPLRYLGIDTAKSSLGLEFGALTVGATASANISQVTNILGAAIGSRELTYQWQYRTATTPIVWATIPSATGQTYTIGRVIPDNNATHMRVVGIDATDNNVTIFGPDESGLVLERAPTGALQLEERESRTGAWGMDGNDYVRNNNAGAEVALGSLVDANGISVITYQWQQSNNAGSTWSNIVANTLAVDTGFGPQNVRYNPIPGELNGGNLQLRALATVTDELGEKYSYTVVADDGSPLAVTDTPLANGGRIQLLNQTHPRPNGTVLLRVGIGANPPPQDINGFLRATFFVQGVDAAGTKTTVTTAITATTSQAEYRFPADSFVWKGTHVSISYSVVIIDGYGFIQELNASNAESLPTPASGGILSANPIAADATVSVVFTGITDNNGFTTPTVVANSVTYAWRSPAGHTTTSSIYVLTAEDVTMLRSVQFSVTVKI